MPDFALPSQVAVTVHTETKAGSGITFAPKSRGNEIEKSIQAYYTDAIVCHSVSQLWGSLFCHYYCYYYYYYYY